VLHNGKVVTSGLANLIKWNLHYEPLKDKLLRDTKWPHETFKQVDWEAYRKALASLPRTTKISITKLSHQLWNTNRQNKKYYGQPKHCP
jgi:hypothetical protein